MADPYADLPQAPLARLPGTLKAEPSEGFLGAVGATIALSPVWQGGMRVREGLMPEEPGYSPFMGGRLEGYEQYADWFVGVKSSAQEFALKQRIDRNRERREIEDRDGGFWSGVTAAAFDPLNYLPGPGVVGRGMLRGALMLGASNVAIQTAASGIQMAVDPTATIDEELARIKYAGLFGALLGAPLGRIGAKSAGETADLFIKQMRRQDEILGGTSLETKAADDVVPEMRGNAKPVADPADPVPPLARMTMDEGLPRPAARTDGPEVSASAPDLRPLPGATFEIRETPEGGAGLAPAFGAEELAARIGPLNALQNSPVQAVGDIAHAIGGEGSVLTKANQQGMASMPSAFIRSGRWVAMSRDVISKIEVAWMRGLTGGTPMSIGGLNVGGAIRRGRDFVGDLMGRSNDELTLADFNEAITLSHKADRIEVPDTVNGKVVTDAMKEQIRKIVPEIRTFYDQALHEAANAGWIKTDEFMRRKALNWRERFDAQTGRLRELMDKIALSENEKAELVLLNRSVSLLKSRIDRIRWDRIATDGELASIVDAKMERIRAIQATAQMDFDYMAVVGEIDRELRAEILSALEGRLARGEDLTPDQMKLLDDLTRPELPIVPNAVKGGAVDPSKAFSMSRDWRSVYDASGVRRADEGAQGVVPSWYERLQQLSDALASHLDVPPPKLWLGEPVEKTVQGQMWPVTSVSPGFEMVLRPDLSERAALAVLLHEFSHVVDFQAFRKLPLKDQRAVERAFRRWEAGLGNKTLGQIDVTANVSGEELRGSNVSLIGLSIIDPRFYSYVTSFEEWMAEQGVAFLTADRKPTDVVERFFAGVTAEWKRSFKAVAGRDGSAREVADFYLGRWRDSGSISRDDFLKDPPALEAALERLRGLATGDAAVIRKMRQEVGDTLGKIMRGEIKHAGAPNEAYYFNRVWDADKVMEGRAELEAILTRHFNENPKEMWKPTAAETARDFIDGILHRDDDTLAQVSDSFGASHNKRRVVSIPNEQVMKFISTNMSDLITDYASKAGVGIEYARMFDGDPLAKEAIEEVMLKAASELPGTAKQILATIQGYRNDLEVVMRTAQHRMGAGMVLTADRVLVDTATSYINTVTMGRVVLSAIVETARPIMTRGFMNNLQFVTEGLFGQLDNVMRDAGKLRMLMAETWDVAHGMQAASFMSDLGPRRAKQTELARSLDRATGGFNRFAATHYYVMNGLSHVTDALKTYTMMLSSHFMLDDIARVAAGKADDKTIVRLASYGIDADTARGIAAMPTQRSGRINLANISAWEDRELAMKFSSAVAMEVRRTIVTPGPADKTAIQQGFLMGRDGKMREAALLKLPFQFLSWGIAANNKVLLSFLQGRDQGAMSGMIALFGMGIVSTYLKASEAQWDKMDWEERFYMGVQNSGLLGSFTDVNRLIETGSLGQYGMRPALGLPAEFGRTPDERSLAATPFGAVGSRALELHTLMTDPYATQDQRASIIRRAIPLNNLLYTDGLFRSMQEGATWTYNRF